MDNVNGAEDILGSQWPCVCTIDKIPYMSVYKLDFFNPSPVISGE